MWKTGPKWHQKYQQLRVECCEWGHFPPEYLKDLKQQQPTVPRLGIVRGGRKKLLSWIIRQNVEQRFQPCLSLSSCLPCRFLRVNGLVMLILLYFGAATISIYSKHHLTSRHLRSFDGQYCDYSGDHLALICLFP